MLHGANPNRFRPNEPHGYEQISLTEIEAGLAQCEEDLSSRAVTAALRICREQLIARDVDLGPTAVLFFFTAVIAYLWWAYCQTFGYWPPHSLLLPLLAGTVALAYFWHCTLAFRDQRLTARRERKAIRVMTARTLGILVREGVEAPPLEREKYDVLRDLIRTEKRPELRKLLVR